MALAADPTCDARAKEKKLAGAALKSFMTKCEKDSTDKCAADAKTKNLHGAALSVSVMLVILAVIVVTRLLDRRFGSRT